MAMLIGSSLSAPSAQAGYIVTLTQQGGNVVATGSGTIDLTGLSLVSGSGVAAFMTPDQGQIYTGPVIATAASLYTGPTGPTSFGSGGEVVTSTGSGDIVGIHGLPAETVGPPYLVVPEFYVSGAALSDTATYDNASFSSLGVTPGTYTWTWGAAAADDSFTLQVGAVPAPLIGRGLPVLLAVGGLLVGAKLLEGGKMRRLKLRATA
jgi:hypothetical protein